MVIDAALVNSILTLVYYGFIAYAVGIVLGVAVVGFLICLGVFD